MIPLPAVLPSPDQGLWMVGPVPLRAYALWILLGIVVAVWLGDRRWRARGGRPGEVLDIAAWAVPFGIVGGRIYHVLTSWDTYFGPDGDPAEALMIWRGGLGIWGAVALGAVGAWIGARRAGILLPPFGDAVAPGIVLAQAIGRLGNWFNNELYGRATDLPWGLRIYEWDNAAGRALLGPDGEPVVRGVFHPTFLYELLWNVGVAAALILLDRRFRLGHGRVFALYVLLYTIGRAWIEALRIDPSNTVLGLRLNLWTSLLVGLGALAYLVISARRRPGREVRVHRDGPDDPTGEDADPDPDPGETTGAEAGTGTATTTATTTTATDDGTESPVEASTDADVERTGEPAEAEGTGAAVEATPEPAVGTTASAQAPGSTTTGGSTRADVPAQGSDAEIPAHKG